MIGGLDDWGEEIGHFRLGTTPVRVKDRKRRTAKLLASLPHEIDKIKAERQASVLKRDARKIVHGLGGPELVAEKLGIRVETVVHWLVARKEVPVERVAELRAAFPEQVGRVLPCHIKQEAICSE
jgi:hypothetical protein